MAAALVPSVVTPKVASAATLAAPTGLHQTESGKSSIKFAWDAVPGANKYRVSWSSNGTSDWYVSSNPYSPSTTISNLSSGSTYYVKVCAMDTTGKTDVVGADSEVLQVVTTPDEDQMAAITVTNATTTSLTFTWGSAPGATAYTVYDYSTGTLLATTSETTFTWTDLAAGNSYRIKVFPVKTSASGYVATPSSYNYIASSSTSTKPETPTTATTANFGLGTVYYNINVAYFSAQDPAQAAKGYEIEVYTLKGNKKVFTATSSNNRFVVTRNTAYKYRCRFYTTYNNENIYGAWSGYRYFCYQTVTGKKYTNRIKMSWKKVSNAKSYTVYVSTSEKGGYKKVKTVGKKTTSLTIRKYGKKKIKKNGSYYVKVVANLTDGKKSVKSDTYYVGKSS
jgi:hypothetical protein